MEHEPRSTHRIGHRSYRPAVPVLVDAFILASNDASRLSRTFYSMLSKRQDPQDRIFSNIRDPIFRYVEQSLFPITSAIFENA